MIGFDEERWVSVAFCALGIIGLAANEQDVFLRVLLKDRFADVPDGMPSPDDTQGFADYSVKLLLRALLDDGSDGNRMRVAAAMTFDAMWLKREPPQPKPRLVCDND